MKKTNEKQKTIDSFPHQPDANKAYPHHYPQNTLPFADKIGNYQRNIGRPTDAYKDSKVYIIGSGIAGLSSAYYFIRDGKVPAENITFLEQLEVSGGSMDGSGNAKNGYIIRGGREMEFTYENFWDVFQDIPAVEMPEPYSVLGCVDIYRIIDNHSVMTRLTLSDAQWAKIAPYCAGKETDVGRTAVNNRLFIEAVLWIVRTGSPWRDLPPEFGNWNSVYKRYRRWVKSDRFSKLFNALNDSDLEYAMIDGTIVKVHRHGQGAKGGLVIRQLANQEAV